MAHREMIYLKGFSKGKQFYNTLKMIHIASKYHEGQTRKSGEPYIDHPMRVTSALVALGIEDDIILAGAMGHDLYEDTSLTPTLLIETYGMNPVVSELIQQLSKNSETSTQYYYNVLKSDVRMILIKLADRCHNVSTMVGSFSVEKLKEYVSETEEYVLPLCKYGSLHYPEYSSQLYTMKYHIESILSTVKNFISLLESE